RPAGKRGDIGARSASACRTVLHPIEEAHQSLGHDEIAIRADLGEKHSQQFRRHCPAIQVHARPPGRSHMKGRIDVIGPALRTAYTQTAPCQCAHQSECHRCLTAPGARRGDEQSGRVHSAASASAKTTAPPMTVADANKPRSDTMEPIPTIAGGSNPAALASAEIRESVLSSTRWSG